MDLERTLTSREEINNALRASSTKLPAMGHPGEPGRAQGHRPPPSIQDSMEKQMRADRDKRAAILNAEGVRQSQILTAEGQKQAAILTAEGNKQSQILNVEAAKQSQILRADGEAKAIHAVFDAIHRGNPDQKLLSYQYLQMLPRSPAVMPTRSGSSPARSAPRSKASERPSGASVPHRSAAPRRRCRRSRWPRGRDLAEVQAAADEAVQETEAAVSAARRGPGALEAAQQASAASEPHLRRE